MSSAIKILPHYTYEDYEQWEGRGELIEGILFAMSPSRVPKHQSISGNLFSEFKLGLRFCSNGCKVYQPIDYRVKDDIILQPDLLVVCGGIVKKYLDFAPALVAEILSPSTTLRTGILSLTFMNRKGVPYYVIINVETEVAEIFELRNSSYELADNGREVKFAFKSGGGKISVDFSEIWV